MTNNFTYFRKYIIFKTDYQNISNINPKGHGKIEIKEIRGNIGINIENCEIEKDYIISFLKDSNGQVMEFKLGRIITDHKGRGRANIPINLKDLQSQGFSIEDINAILIRKDFHILLGGYIHEDTGTIEKFVKNLTLEKKSEEIITEYDTMEETIEEIDILEEVIVEEPDILEETDTLEKMEIEETIGKEIEKIGEVKEISQVEEKSEDFNNAFIETELEGNLEETLIVEDNLSEEIEYTPPEEKEMENYESQEYIRRLNHKNQMISYILNILRFFPYVQPFKINLYGYSWWQIDDDGTDSYQGFLPYFNYLMSADYKYPFLNNSTTCFNQIKKYGHYLFGLYEEDGDTKYYIYGVPGKFTKEEHPFKGITGFNIWFESMDNMGYWLLYINPMTGEIIYPLNPMVPAD